MSSVRDGLPGAPASVVGNAHQLLPDSPDPSCTFCIVLAALPFPEDRGQETRADEGPEGASEVVCAFHWLLYRRLQCQGRCQGWNADRTHQVLAGKARAQQFTTAYQQAAGHAAWDAFSARWRALQDLAPLSAQAGRKYLTPDLICGSLGLELQPALQQSIYQARCAAYLRHVTAWQSNDPPPDPNSL